jgi:ataxin-3
MLCGVHCVNALLQGPHFDEVQLAQIAHAIDEEEQALFGGQDMQGLRKGQVSHNVANDGNFSIQVIQKALL